MGEMIADCSPTFVHRFVREDKRLNEWTCLRCKLTCGPDEAIGWLTRLATMFAGEPYVEPVGTSEASYTTYGAANT